LADHLPPL